MVEKRSGSCVRRASSVNDVPDSGHKDTISPLQATYNMYRCFDENVTSQVADVIYVVRPDDPFYQYKPQCVVTIKAFLGRKILDGLPLGCSACAKPPEMEQPSSLESAMARGSDDHFLVIAKKAGFTEDVSGTAELPISRSEEGHLPYFGSK